MLEMEKARAQRKIEETRKKTAQIKELKLRNDIKYQSEIIHEVQKIKEKPAYNPA